MSTIYGKPLFIGSATPKLPDVFGDGSDGDLVIQAGDTVTLPVPVPHQSVVEKRYKSITIEAGGTLTTSDPNAGLVLRCQGDCTIHGTIDQSGKAPKTNPDSTYPYPEELQCGDGGAGGNGGGRTSVAGGTAMAARPYGGGYGAGGGGANGNDSDDGTGGVGGSTNDTTILIPDEQLFAGGARGLARGGSGSPGTNGGGGGGGALDDRGANGGAGGTGPGGTGATGTTGNNGKGGGGGGAGNYGGGVVLVYVGGNFFFDGTIDCSGKNGGNGGNLTTIGRGGGGGGGGGGGSIYVLHMGTQTVTGGFNVNGGSGGAARTGDTATNGAAGGIGTTTIKQYEET